MEGNEIVTEEELKNTFLKNQDNVISCLTETPTDLKLLEDKLNAIGISFDLYCPLPPYNHDYDVIDEFMHKVEQEKKGTIMTKNLFFSSQ